MTDQKIDVTFPQIEFRKVGELPNMFDDPEEDYIVIIVQVEVEKENGETEMMGTQLLLMNKEGGKELAQYLTGQEDDGELTDMEASALKETGNILSGSCLTAITKYVDLKLKEGVPVIEQNPLGEIMDEVIMETNHTENNTALIFGTEFEFEKSLEAYFLFLFQPGQEKLITDRLV